MCSRAPLQEGLHDQGLRQEKLTALRQCITRIHINKPAREIELALRTVPTGNLDATNGLAVALVHLCNPSRSPRGPRNWYALGVGRQYDAVEAAELWIAVGHANIVLLKRERDG